jgi:hypothetical protein
MMSYNVYVANLAKGPEQGVGNTGGRSGPTPEAATVAATLPRPRHRVARFTATAEPAD